MAVVAAGVAVPLLWLAAVRLAAPADGTLHYFSAGDSSTSGVEVVRVVGQSGLRPGDVVVEIDGRSVEHWLERGSARDIQVGDTVRYTVVTSEGAQQRIDVRMFRYPVLAALATAYGDVLLVCTMFVVGAVVFLHRPRDPAARASFAIPVLVAIGATARPFGPQVLELVVPYGWWPYLAASLANTVTWGAVLHLAVALAGRDRGRSVPRWVAGFAYAVPFLLYGTQLLLWLPRTEDPLERLRMALQVSLPAARAVPVLIVLVLGASVAWDRRRPSWAVAVVGACACSYLVLAHAPGLVGRSSLPLQWATLALLPVPAVMAVAVLRRRVFDIVVVAHRSVISAALTAGLLGVYVVCVVVLVDVTDPSDNLIAVLAAGAAAMSLHPLQVRLRRRVGRRLYGDREEPTAVTSRLAGIEFGGPPTAMMDRLVGVLAEALRLRYVAVDVGDPRAGPTFQSQWGEPDPDAEVVPLMWAGAQIGTLALGVTPGIESFGRADRKLLDELARQVGAVSYVMVITTDLQHARQRVVEAREEERRRLRRDLHDGLGPSLAAAAMQLDVAHHAVDRSPDVARQVISDLAENLRSSVAEIRRLIDDLRPPALDELGLVAAIEERAAYFASGGGTAGTPVRIVVEGTGQLDDLPAAAEVAAFRIAIEAITNAVRHSHASVCTVSITKGAELTVAVTDDGQGMGAAVAGVGLMSMRERALELGGTFQMNSGSSGCRVVAQLPLRDPYGPSRLPAGEPGHQSHDSGTLTGPR